MAKFRHQSSRIFNLLTIVILILLCLLLQKLTQINFHHLELPKDKPAYLASNFSGYIYNKSGKLIYQFNAESGTQYPDSNQINMTNLELLVYNVQESSAQYRLTSNDGWFNNIDNLGYLGQNVILTQESRIESHITHIYTKKVNLNANTMKATSSSPVLAQQNHNTMQGVGFIFNYESQTLFLESHVRVYYEPK